MDMKESTFPRGSCHRLANETGTLAAAEALAAL